VTTIELDVSKWDAWRPEQVARLFAGVRAPWYVAAGWAIDLFLGDERRVHGDLEVAVPSARFDELAEVLRPFEVVFINEHQTWVREPATGAWRLDIFREPSEVDAWVCRRDPTIRLPYAQLIEWTADGIPFGRPEVVLLFKAKRSEEEKNRGDLEAVLPRLDAERRRWLRQALARVHPGHPWLDELGRRAA
jgi:Aminoglycoside-2''-adenylyltransferase